MVGGVVEVKFDFLRKQTYVVNCFSVPELEIKCLYIFYDFKYNTKEREPYLKWQNNIGKAMRRRA